MPQGWDQSLDGHFISVLGVYPSVRIYLLLLDAFWHTRPCSLLQQNRYLKLIDWMQNALIWDWNQPHPFKKEEDGTEHLFLSSPRIFLEMSGCPDPLAGGWSCLLHLNPGMRLNRGSEEPSRMASSIQGNPLLPRFVPALGIPNPCFSTRSSAKLFPRFLERDQKLFLFTLQYPSPGTRVFLWNIIKKVYFLQK